jgi:prepilin-type processing-associated H-X9-DG protein
MRPAIPSCSRRESAPVSSDFGNKLERTHPTTRDCYSDVAFTLIELLVVLGTMAVLGVMLLPALAGTQAQSKVTACAARYRQWAASANLYANDNRGWLPTGDPQLGGEYACDVGTNMLDALYPYGMDVPDYFCPMRPNEWDAATEWMLSKPVGSLGPPPGQNINGLGMYWRSQWSSQFHINDNYWVQRIHYGAVTFPPTYTPAMLSRGANWLRTNTATCITYGWPTRLHDLAAPYVPFVSDLAGSGNGGGLISPIVGTTVNDISPNTAHYVNGVLLGVNLAFADGHVASHTPDQMRCVFGSGGGPPYWFY